MTPRVDCGQCPRISTGCKEGYCLKGDNAPKPAMIPIQLELFKKEKK